MEWNCNSLWYFLVVLVVFGIIESHAENGGFCFTAFVLEGVLERSRYLAFGSGAMLCFDNVAFLCAFGIGGSGSFEHLAFESCLFDLVFEHSGFGIEHLSIGY